MPAKTAVGWSRQKRFSGSRPWIAASLAAWALLDGTTPRSTAASQQSKTPAPATYSIPLPPKPDFSSISWLIGDWTGTTAGQGRAGTIHLHAALDLGNRYIVLRQELSLPATKTAPATRESWMGILSPGDPDFILNTFSSTGFMTRYRVTVNGTQIYFIPEGGEQPPPGWLFRSAFEHTGPSGMTITVQASPPNRPFFVYYTAKLAREASK